MDKGQAHASSGLYGTSATQTKLSVVPRLMAEADSRRLAAGLLKGKVCVAVEASKWSASWYQTL
jgi:hypothetical protein